MRRKYKKIFLDGLEGASPSDSCFALWKKEDNLWDTRLCSVSEG